MLARSSTSRLLISSLRPLPVHSPRHPLTRTISSTPPLLAEPELNEAQQYLAAKAARKAARASNPTGASARHGSVYSQLFPALLRILAYGSSAYFGLHLLWNVLDRDEQTKLMNAHTEGLESTARSLAGKVEKAQEQVRGAVEEGKEKVEKRGWWPF